MVTNFDIQVALYYQTLYYTNISETMWRPMVIQDYAGRDHNTIPLILVK
jgi:hypothetical protein